MTRVRKDQIQPGGSMDFSPVGNVTTLSGGARLFSKTIGGIAKMMYRDSTGAEFVVGEAMSAGITDSLPFILDGDMTYCLANLNRAFFTTATATMNVTADYEENTVDVPIGGNVPAEEPMYYIEYTASENTEIAYMIDLGSDYPISSYRVTQGLYWNSAAACSLQYSFNNVTYTSVGDIPIMTTDTGYTSIDVVSARYWRLMTLAPADPGDAYWEINTIELKESLATPEAVRFPIGDSDKVIGSDGSKPIWTYARHKRPQVSLATATPYYVQVNDDVVIAANTGDPAYIYLPDPSTAVGSVFTIYKTQGVGSTRIAVDPVFSGWAGDHFWESWPDGYETLTRLYEAMTLCCDGSQYYVTDIKGGSTLASHSDVSTTAPTDGQVLAWNASLSKYVPSSVAGGVTRYPPTVNTWTSWMDQGNASLVAHTGFVSFVAPSSTPVINRCKYNNVSSSSWEVRMLVQPTPFSSQFGFWIQEDYYGRYAGFIVDGMNAYITRHDSTFSVTPTTTLVTKPIWGPSAMMWLKLVYGSDILWFYLSYDGEIYDFIGWCTKDDLGTTGKSSAPRYLGMFHRTTTNATQELPILSWHMY